MTSEGKGPHDLGPQGSGDPERDALWNPDLVGDPELQRLEELLGTYRHESTAKEYQLWRHDAVAFGGRDGRGADRTVSPEQRSPWWRSTVWVALAAGLLGVLTWRVVGSGPVNEPNSAGDTGLEGSFARGSFWVDSSREGAKTLRVGDEVVAGNQDLVIEVAELGEVTLTPGTRLRVEEDEEALSSLFLEEGTVVASILAEPRTFQIGTPAGLTVDLGCVYSVSVREDGIADLHVREGRVSFETEGRTVTVPQGARCQSIPGRGPSAPVFTDVEPEFEALVRRIESADPPNSSDLKALRSLARRKDTLTLYHMLRNEGRLAVRQAAYNGLKKFIHDPVGRSEQDALNRDPETLEEWHRNLRSSW